MNQYDREYAPDVEYLAERKEAEELAARRARMALEYNHGMDSFSPGVSNPTGDSADQEWYNVNTPGHPQFEGPERQYGIQNETFREMYDTPMKSIADLTHGALEQIPGLDTVARLSGITGLMDLGGMMGLKSGEVIPLMEAPEQMMIAKQKWEEGDTLGARRAGALGLVEGSGVLAGAAKGAHGAYKLADRLIPDPDPWMDDIIMQGALNSSPGRGMTSTVIGSKAKNWRAGGAGDMIDLRMDLDKNLPNMSESNKLDATGIARTPQGDYQRTIADLDLKMKDLPLPSATRIKQHYADQKLSKEWDDLRAQHPFANFAEFKARHQDVYDRAFPAKDRMYEYGVDYFSPLTDKTSDVVTGSVALDNYPQLRDYDFTRDPMRDGGEIAGRKIVVGKNNQGVAGHELGHGVSGLEDWPRGGNTQEMRDLDYDLNSELGDTDQLMTALDQARADHLAKGDLRGADIQAREIERLQEKYDGLREQLTISPFDRYQSLYDERLQRYTQHGVDNRLSQDELNMFRPMDFFEKERRRTKLEDLVTYGNQRLKPL